MSAALRPRLPCSSLLTSPNPNEYDEHNIWNPTLGIFCHVQVGVFMEAYVDEVDLGRNALSCHFLWMYYVTRQRCTLPPVPLPLVTSPCCDSDHPGAAWNTSSRRHHVCSLNEKTRWKTGKGIYPKKKKSPCETPLCLERCNNGVRTKRGPFS